MEIEINFDLDKYDDELITKLTSDKSSSIFEGFKNWFDSVDSDLHHTQKKAIINSKLSDFLSKENPDDRLLTLLHSVPQFAEQVIKSYELYLEEFSYSKFSKKLEEKTIEYLEKISKSVLDIRNQIISLPISFLILNVVKQTGVNSVYLFGGMCVYCLILFLILRQQKQYLSDLRDEIYKFIDQPINVTSIKSEFLSIKDILDKRIKSQRNILRLFQFIVLTAFVASFFQYSPATLDTLLDFLNSLSKFGADKEA